MTLHSGRSRLLCALLLCLSLFSSACTADEVSANLERTLLAVQIALPSVLAASGVDPATVAQVQHYLGTVSNAVATSADVLADEAQTPAQAGAAVALAFAGAIAPDLPPGTPTTINVAVQSVAAAVQAFLRQVRTTSAEIQFSRPEMATAFRGSKRHKANRARLDALRRKAERTRREIEEATKAH